METARAERLGGLGALGRAVALALGYGTGLMALCDRAGLAGAPLVFGAGR